MKKEHYSIERNSYFGAQRDAQKALLNAAANPSEATDITLLKHRYVIAHLLSTVNSGTSLTTGTKDRVACALIGFLASLFSLAVIFSVEPLRGLYATLGRLVGSEACVVCCHFVVCAAVGGYALWKLYVRSSINTERKRLSDLLGRIDKKQVGSHLEEYYAQAVDDARSVILASRSYSYSDMRAKLQSCRNAVTYLLDAANGGASLDNSKNTYTLTAICVLYAATLYYVILELLGFSIAVPELFKSQWAQVAAFLTVELAVSAIGSAILGTMITATIQSNRRRTLSNLLKQIDDELNQV